VALLRHGQRKLALAILTRGDPSEHYGAETVPGGDGAAAAPLQRPDPLIDFRGHRSY
jgi:hypothetical protein